MNVCNVFHAGDGNLHPNITYNASDADETARVHTAMSEIMTVCVDAGGTITGEHGVGLDKVPYMELIFSPDSLATMCALREVFDPDRRSNPGKVVPVHSCREWHAAPSARRAGGASHDDRSRRRVASRRFATAFATQRSAATPLRIVGGGTWLDAGRPVAATETLSTREHSGITEYVPGDLTLTARAGTTLGEIRDATAAHGQWLALDPYGADDGTLGATIATGAAGPLSTFFGRRATSCSASNS